MVIKRKSSKRKLGTGLSSLLVKDEELASIVKRAGRPSKKIEPGESSKKIKKITLLPKDSSTQLNVPTHFIVPGKFQPRKSFNSTEIDELADSIKQNGILQPILVRPLNNRGTSLEIIAGERRWRAAQLAKLHEVPVIIRNFDDETALGVALVENLQRSDLNTLEEAEGYRLLMNKFGYTQEKLSIHLGKSRSHIANFLRLLSMPKIIQERLNSGDLTYGHARAIITLDEDNALLLAETIIEKDLSVRATEVLVRKQKRTSVNSNNVSSVQEDPNITLLEKELTTLLGLKVTISNNQKNQGSLQIHYKNLDQLEPIIDKLRWMPK